MMEWWMVITVKQKELWRLTCGKQAASWTIYFGWISTERDVIGERFVCDDSILSKDQRSGEQEH